MWAKLTLPTWARPPADQSGRRTYIGAVAALVTVCLAVLLFQWNALVGPGAQRTIPLVAGTSVEAAEKSLRSNDLEPIQREAYDERIPAGLVIGTVPFANTEVTRGDRIELLVSKGPEKLQVPDVRNKPLAEARAILERGKLALREPLITDYSDTVPKDAVITSSPAPGTAAKMGNLITLTVSKGTKPTPASEIIGRTFDDAKAFLASKGITLNPGDQVFSEHPVGTIASLNPNETSYTSGATLTAAISKGPENVVIPPVEGMSISDATAALKGAGLNVTYSRWIASGMYRRAGTTNPPAGQTVPRGYTVMLLPYSGFP